MTETAQPKPRISDGDILAWCGKCGRHLPSSEFHKRKTNIERGGLLVHPCKSCGLAAARDWRRRNPDKAYAADRRGRLQNMAAHRARVRKWTLKNPERVKIAKRAANVVALAIRRGVLTRPNACEKCGSAGFVEASHSDYSKPLLVQWLCRRCHRRLDRRDPRTLVAPPRQARYSREKLIEILVDFRLREGRMPRSIDCGGDLPSCSTLKFYFGSISAAFHEASQSCGAVEEREVATTK